MESTGLNFNTIRTLLGYTVIALLIAYPYFAHQKGRPFWQTGFAWKWAVFAIVGWIAELVLSFFAGLVIALAFSSYAASGGMYNMNVLYVALAGVYIVQIAILGYVILKK